jgi:hypothetical protein
MTLAPVQVALLQTFDFSLSTLVAAVVNYAYYVLLAFIVASSREGSKSRVVSAMLGCSPALRYLWLSLPAGPTTIPPQLRGGPRRSMAAYGGR